MQVSRQKRGLPSSSPFSSLPVAEESKPAKLLHFWTGANQTEPVWVTFSLLAALAIQELGIPPLPAPAALEHDPAWREQCQLIGGNDPEAVPFGLSEVDSCTRAWLHFLRRESLSNESRVFQRRPSGGSFPDVWEASAAQCERSARERIQVGLVAEAPSTAVPGVPPPRDGDVVPPSQSASAEGTMEGPTVSLFGTRPVTVVRDVGTPQEKRWIAPMGGDFSRTVIFNQKDAARTGDELHSDLFDVPRRVIRVDPVLMRAGVVAHWEARIIPQSIRRPQVSVTQGTPTPRHKPTVPGPTETRESEEAGAEPGRLAFPSPFQEDASASPLGDNPFPADHPAHAVFEEATWEAKKAINRSKLETLKTAKEPQADPVQSLLTFRMRYFSICANAAVLIVGNAETALAYERWIDAFAEFMLQETLEKGQLPDPLAAPGTSALFAPEILPKIQADLSLELVRVVAYYKEQAAGRVLRVIQAQTTAAAVGSEGIGKATLPNGEVPVSEKAGVKEPAVLDQDSQAVLSEQECSLQEISAEELDGWAPVHRATWEEDAAYADECPAFLRPAKAARMEAIATLRKRATEAFHASKPQTSEELAKCLWPSHSEYAQQVFDDVAEAKLIRVSPAGKRPRGYERWLRSKCLPAVVDDVCASVYGHFVITVRYIAEQIGEVNWPQDLATARRILWRVYAENLIGGVLTQALEKRLSQMLVAEKIPLWVARSERRQPPTAPESARPVEGRPGRTAKGNLGLLREDGKLKRAVTLDTAARFGGVGRRAIEKALRKGPLEAEGEGQNRRVIVESLLQYFPPENTAN